MPRTRSIYVCEACGNESLKWQGQCPACGAWNSLGSVRLGRTARRGDPAATAGVASIQRLAEVALEEEPRFATGISEFDRVLGGGLVPGSVTLLGGDPGIGKSTLLLQAGDALSRLRTTLYVTGEESPKQVSLRARRLDVTGESLHLLAETCIETVLAAAQARSAHIVIVDSIQTVYTDAVESSPGSAAQVREAAAQLVRFAKSTGTAVLIIGHVTKEGLIAGPRILEHMVDTVLYFESEVGSRFRMIRSVKNRFGAANEIGVFAMTESGLREVRNPSAIFLSRHVEPVAGSVVMVAREGSRPMLVEVQALVDDAQSVNPRRVAVGLDQSRLALLLAVLHRHGGVSMAGQDVFVNVVGGVRIAETAADLAALLAAVSSLRGRPLPAELVCFGEVGLAGEVRPVPYGEERLREAAKHGFRRAIVPAANAPKKPPRDIEVVAIERIAQALDHAF